MWPFRLPSVLKLPKHSRIDMFYVVRFVSRKLNFELNLPLLSSHQTLNHAFQYFATPELPLMCKFSQHNLTTDVAIIEDVVLWKHVAPPSSPMYGEKLGIWGIQ